MKKPSKKPTADKTTVRRARPRAQWNITPQNAPAQWDSETIKALREHMRMTQTQMAETLGTRQQTISEWEVGMYKPRGGMVRLLSLVAERAQFEYKTAADK